MKRQLFDVMRYCSDNDAVELEELVDNSDEMVEASKLPACLVTLRAQ